MEPRSPPDRDGGDGGRAAGRRPHLRPRADGSECQWSRVLAYEPPSLFVFSWDINTRWEIETDPAKTSEVAVTFTAEAPDRTRVALEHRHLDRHGEGWEGMRDAVGSGWANLDDFAAAAAGNAPYPAGRA